MLSNTDHRVLEVPDKMTTLISNSEVDSFLSCERKHYYAFGLKLEPVRQSESLNRGIIGHLALAEYYSALQEGKPNNLARAAGFNVVDQAFLKSTFPDEKTMLVGLRNLLNDYYECYESDKFEIVAVEKQYDLQFGADYDYGYGMRLDLLIRETEGYYAGEYAVIDHKFVYDFYQPETVTLSVQLPKYIGTVRANGLVVKRGYINQIRHRTKKGPMTYDEKFKRVMVTPSTRKIRNIMVEQAKASERIMRLKGMPLNEWSDEVLRSRNNMICKNCPFRYLCDAELDGQDVSLMIKSEFQQNSYVGYALEDEA